MRPTTVHPRWRGEQRSSSVASGMDSGSSPLARGTADPEGAQRGDRRFIPAGAGNSTTALLRKSWLTVHPRWRGEQVLAKASRSSLPGSSPLARGTGRFVKWNEPPTRFIPAGAGNRLLEALEGLAEAVHPRWRGEQGTFDTENGWLGGSSPLARGTGEQNAGRDSGGRFIPAGAGNRLGDGCGLAMGAVHPRWRGEQFFTGSP